ncbi:MAG: ribose-5-phosphate isomerase RpiA [Hyphomicrobiales bacterium]|nr:ribose-5-phosphate isomerase RpiA [Hyphomicrobiales bacterium]
MQSGDDFKKAAALRALDDVRPGMRLGLGTGSTAAHFIAALGARVAAGLDVMCVPTSTASADQASALGIPVSTLDDTPELDLTVDGADEIGPALALIKGGGGALLREKIVATASRRLIIIADAGKRVATLGAFPLPIEIVPFGRDVTRQAIAAAARRLGLGGELVLRQRRDGATFVTDGGHLIVDASFRSIPDPLALARALNAIPGVVEHGLFLGLAHLAIIAGPGGINEISAS